MTGGLIWKRKGTDVNRKIWVAYGAEKLREAGIDNPDGEAWYLFSHSFSLSREDYLFSMTAPVEDGEELNRYKALLERRVTERIPLQYLTGTQDFMGYTFRVTPDVLIPRQDTESVIEAVVEGNYPHKSILDVCTGSGCIAISLCLMLKPELCIGTDIDEKALEIAKENGRRLAPMVKFKKSDLFSGVEGTFDLIISNPPYIPTKDCMELMPEVKDHEPILALDGKEDGLYFYRKLVREAPGYLNSGGTLVFEIGYDQGAAVKTMMEEARFSSVKIKKDLAGLDRMVIGTLTEGEEDV